MQISQAEMLAAQGDQMQQAGRYDEAITLYRESLNASSSEDDHLFQAVVYRGLGAAYMGKEDFVRAIPELQASAALNDGEADTHYLLGMAYFQIGQEDRALEELLRVRDIDPHYPNLDSSIQAVGQVAAPDYRY
jgi:tetratricopeptide (TPR) repeat protein